MNLTLTSVHGGSLEITRTVPWIEHYAYITVPLIEHYAYITVPLIENYAYITVPLIEHYAYSPFNRTETLKHCKKHFKGCQEKIKRNDQKFNHKNFLQKSLWIIDK